MRLGWVRTGSALPMWSGEERPPRVRHDGRRSSFGTPSGRCCSGAWPTATMAPARDAAGARADRAATPRNRGR